MARLSRVVVPNIAHHVVNRGNRRQMVFFKDEDYKVFLELLALFSSAYQVQIAAYCLSSSARRIFEMHRVTKIRLALKQ